MKPWEGKHWKEEEKSIWNPEMDDDELPVSSLFRDGKQVAHTRLMMALQKDWEERNKRYCESCELSNDGHFLDAIRCPRCGGTYD